MSSSGQGLSTKNKPCPIVSQTCPSVASPPVQTLLLQVYEEVRNEKAQEVYGKRLQDLSADERAQINLLVPLSISEAETI